MARNRYDFTERKLARFLREGRGAGELEEYVPWLTVADVPSRGRSRRVFCSINNRVMHLLSDNEYRALLHYWWQPTVTDIKEQFPLLPRDETQEIAHSLGIRHPRDPKTQVDIVMTDDLLVSELVNGESSFLAVSVKDTRDVGGNRVQEKHAIAEEYWRRRGVAHVVYTSDPLSIYHRNLDWILGGDSARLHHLDDDLPTIYLPKIASASKKAGQTIDQACRLVDINEGVHGIAIVALRRALYRRLMSICLHSEYIPHAPSSWLGGPCS